MLRWGSCCKEYCLEIKHYTRKDGTQGRVEYCINKGCGYSMELPPPPNGATPTPDKPEKGSICTKQGLATS